MAEPRRQHGGSDALILSITLSRIPLAFLFAGLLLTREGLIAGQGGWADQTDRWVLIACGVVLGLIEMSDLLDGLLARFLKRASEWGAILDPYADSISRVVVFWALARADLALWVTPLVMALRDITVAYSRIALMRRGGSVSARLSGKAKAVVQGGGGLLLLFGPVVWPHTESWPKAAVSWIVIVVTALSAIEYVAAAARVAHRSR